MSNIVVSCDKLDVSENAAVTKVSLVRFNKEEIETIKDIAIWPDSSKGTINLLSIIERYSFENPIEETGISEATAAAEIYSFVCKKKSVIWGDFYDPLVLKAILKRNNFPFPTCPYSYREYRTTMLLHKELNLKEFLRLSCTDRAIKISEDVISLYKERKILL